MRIFVFTPLALALVGATLSVDSVQGEGSTFTITLPLTAPTARAPSGA